MSRLYAKLPCLGYRGDAVLPAIYTPASWGAMERYRTKRASGYRLRPVALNPTYGNTWNSGTADTLYFRTGWHVNYQEMH